ncbi:small molecule-binding protein [Blautia sp. An249]|uniref:GyrI-like domain-containing protein n=1 Tax=Blautia sp. An249 TaxID=1965603 RepID=UPI000B3A000C|nr:GyrI-like domain-containing protein [Blautia sp. An249]OUO78161.1 small molecule-binding protein [Blautia sp. An249]
MKYEWKKQDKSLYGAKTAPNLINIPPQNYIMIDGKGNPNDSDFSNRVSALYSLAYAIKMRYKKSEDKGKSENDIDDFSVYPLEGVWSLTEGTQLVKENLEYTIMIRQPDFISKEMFVAALEQVKAKKPSPLFDEIYFDAMQNGMCIEVLHIGSFDTEPYSFEKMKQYAEANNLQYDKKQHREIYLNNTNRVEQSKLKTILRYSII